MEYVEIAEFYQEEQGKAMSSLVIYNAKIYVEKGHFEEALLAVDGVIRSIGSNEEILSQAPTDARRYDAAGRTVVPGFNDSHQHMQSVGEILSNIRLLGADSIGEVKRRVREFIEKNHPAPGTVLHGMGWNQDYFKDEHRLLLKEDLDEMAPDYPLILERACGHILTANSSALALAGITGSTVSGEGGAIDLNEKGEPTGVIRENACSRVLSIIPPATEETLDAQLRLAMAHAAECGVTSVQSMDMRPGKWRETWAAYQRVQAKDPIVRVYQQVNFMEPVEFRQFLSEGLHTGMGDPFLKIGPLKMFADGSLGARTALMRSSAKNICSVRHRPMPSAPMSTACCASRGLSALVMTSIWRAASAQPMKRLKFLLPVAATVGICSA